MRLNTLAIIATTLMFSSTIAVAQPGWGMGGHHHGGGGPGCGMMGGYYNSDPDDYFAGMKLNDQQRQRMRDMMRQYRHDFPRGNMASMGEMHKLVTADKFDEAAVRKLLEKMSQQNMEWRVEKARMQNNMYNQLTPEQKARMEKNYQYRMQQFEEDVKMDAEETKPGSGAATKSSK
ncbi:MAG: Spy/CpxP family protein refolding chaperone [Enterobacteriaceae bacterium]